MPGAGSLRERIIIRRQLNTKNPDTGGLERGWTTLATVWAEVKSLNGREQVIGNTLQGVSTFQITIRYRNDLKPDDQVLWGARELNIVAPPEDPIGDRKWTRMLVNTIAPQGA
jgi:SPP1 family predicted phage head-tail adaptor